VVQTNTKNMIKLFIFESVEDALAFERPKHTEGNRALPTAPASDPNDGPKPEKRTYKKRKPNPERVSFKERIIAKAKGAGKGHGTPHCKLCGGAGHRSNHCPETKTELSKKDDRAVDMLDRIADEDIERA
jgi:hypothetical protein